ncbi:hypothetical protein BD779DRAFT_1244700 [Infundibulicybe gibba]|nr:hypothetical protein BD779DRAFT_1244700 [Infundibulicybe gibba]
MDPSLGSESVPCASGANAPPMMAPMLRFELVRSESPPQHHWEQTPECFGPASYSQIQVRCYVNSLELH